MGLRPVPDDFIEYVTGVESVSFQSLMRRWGAGREVIGRWLAETNLTEQMTNRPVPKSWGEIAPTMNRIELGTHYDVDKRTIARWIIESGVKPLEKKSRYVPRPVIRERKLAKYGGGAIKEVSNAACYLRRFYKCVHRCDIYETAELRWGQNRGLPNWGRGLYYVDGVGVIPNSKLLELAEEHGYEAGRV